MVRSVAGHHVPTILPNTETPSTALLHLANVFEHELLIFNESYTRPKINTDLVAVLGVDENTLEDWMHTCKSLV